ncbi:MAG: adenosylcobinamide-GDP ribazoletransferase [Proteobacteria bacterium]|nr:adenosylcobinamide-GDP ribazoletransferase [Pseudomonadota bacterium]MBU0965819.1 adenosylcobinamide-GDP ribazoletransferase [Pseudomonadota bacterium]
MIRSIAVAISFLTIIPVKLTCVTQEDIAKSGAFFPLTGWIIGMAMACCGWLMLAAGLAPLAAAVLLVAFEAWLTRGLHLDGVADLFDGMGGSFEAEKRLAIMKDSATGAFGVVGIVVVLLLKTAGLSTLLTFVQTWQDLSTFVLFICIAFVPAASRWAMMTLAWKSRYPRKNGTGQMFVGHITVKEILIGFLFLLPVLAAVSSQTRILIGIAAVFYVTMVPSFWLRYRAHELLGGVTGDVLGASCEFGEALGWLAVTLFI